MLCSYDQSNGEYKGHRKEPEYVPFTVFVLTHLLKPETSEKEFVWIDRKYFLNMAFGEVGEKIKAKTALYTG
jgi:hypothetical protein